MILVAMRKQKSASLISVFLFVFTIFFLFPTAVKASLNNTSVTLSNSRLSYKAGVNAGSSGSSLVTINNSGYPDNNTGHLFPGDILCFTDAGQNGCIGNKTYKVDSLVDSTHFNLTSPLANNLDTSGYAIATQSGTWTVAFATVGAVPLGGSILITIPMADNAKGNDSIPDSSGSVSTSGFDLNGILPVNVTVTGGCSNVNWGNPVITVGSGSTDHTISIPRNINSCAGGSSVVVTISGPGIVNPAPISSGHTQGTADIYGVTVTTRDGGGGTIDSSVPRAILTEAVLISTTVDESLSFIISGLSAGTYCGNGTLATTATSVPWGHLATNNFYYAAQELIVSTNSSNGYVVTVQENDQMGKNGNACTGTAPSAGDYTFGSNNCIRDTVCGSSNCSESVAADWTDAVNYPGLGYSEANLAGTDASFLYNDLGKSFNTKQLADVADGETPQTVMSNSGTVSGDSAYMCYRISVPGSQPSGYYYNIAKYTATATF